MTINQIIDKYYPQFLEQCYNKDIPVYCGKTSEDILNDCVITLINKYGNKEIEEKEGYETFKKTFLMEEMFAHKKKDRDILVLSPDIDIYDNRTDES